MILLEGKKVKEEILKTIKKDLENEQDRPGLAIIQVGNDEASNVYIKQKAKMAEELNYKFEHIKLEENIKEEDLLKIIDKLNDDNSIDGIIVQLPMPKNIDYKMIINRINPLKDVDGLTDINMGRLVHNEDTLVSCTSQGIIDLLKYYNIELSGKNVTIIGRSNLVGKPLASLLINNDATVTLCHSKTDSLNTFINNADILVVAVGKAKFIKENQIKEGSIIIDVGINRQEDGKICGDVDFEKVKNKVAYITPVPGGIGPMTIAELAKNTYKAYKNRRKIDNNLK